jgi:hypothetical protein
MSGSRRPRCARLPIAVVLSVLSAHAEDLLPGRLFHTPAERAALDRVALPPSHPAARPVQSRVSEPAGPDSTRLSGFVLRSDGRDSYWIAPAPDGGTVRR